MNHTTRTASEAHEVVSEMRLLVESGEPLADVDDRDRLERLVSTRITTLLMVLLVVIVFATSALPDVGPGLAKAIQAHL
jgi:hypothetical protein